MRCLTPAMIWISECSMCGGISQYIITHVRACMYMHTLHGTLTHVHVHTQTCCWVKLYCISFSHSYMIALELMMPIVMTLAWLFSIAMNVHFIVKEKQLRLKEFMKMMGLSNAVHWTAWFITQLIVVSFSILFMAPMLKYGGLYPKSNLLLIYIYLELYAVSLIFYG